MPLPAGYHLTGVPNKSSIIAGGCTPNGPVNPMGGRPRASKTGLTGNPMKAVSLGAVTKASSIGGCCASPGFGIVNPYLQNILDGLVTEGCHFVPLSAANFTISGSYSVGAPANPGNPPLLGADFEGPHGVIPEGGGGLKFTLEAPSNSFGHQLQVATIVEFYGINDMSYYDYNSPPLLPWPNAPVAVNFDGFSPPYFINPMDGGNSWTASGGVYDDNHITYPPSGYQTLVALGIPNANTTGTSDGHYFMAANPANPLRDYHPTFSGSFNAWMSFGTPWGFRRSSLGSVSAAFTVWIIVGYTLC